MALHQDERWSLPKARVGDLLNLLGEDGYEIVGPRIEQNAIVYGPVRAPSDLPIGWTDRQGPGWYRLEKRSDEAYFGYAVGPHSWKKYLFPPSLRFWQARRTESAFEFFDDEPGPPKHAFLGVRSCELHAIAIQDRVFIDRDGRFTDPFYARARERLLIIAVECEHPGETCFCVSMGTGPEVQPDRIPLSASKHEDAALQAGDRQSARRPLPLATPPPATQTTSPSTPVCDLVLTELDDAFVVRTTSARGEQIVKRLNLRETSTDEVEEGRRRVSAAAQAMGRKVNVTNIRGLLQANQEHPRWDHVADRCLACTNCTLVCPTCFCSSVEDVTDLGLETAERVRRWDSCFNPEFARVHGGNFRPSIRGRYRQWLTHKFASWYDQFDVSGCVGCGRCITWCPVGIDVTEEITAIRATDGQKQEKTQ